MHNTLFAALLLVSIATQIAAAGYAVVNVSYTPRKVPWIFIAVAIVLMAVRRIITLIGTIAAWQTPRTVSWGAELTALLISVLMLTGMVLLNLMIRGVSASIAQKDRLFRESLHTSKNNFQSLKSLLHVQADFAAGSEGRALALELEQKVEAYSLLQQQLFENDLSVDIRTYVKEMIDTIETAYADRERYSPVDDRIEQIEATPKETLYVGLIITEALINAYKYAAVGTAETVGISVTVKTDHTDLKSRVVEVRDTGTGFPQEVLAGNRSGFGLSFLKGFSAPDWNFTFGNAGGAWIRVAF